MRGNNMLLLKEPVKEVKEYRGGDKDLTTGTVICRFDDNETIGHYLAYGTEDDADSVKKDKLAHIVDVLLNSENKIDIAHQKFH